MSDTKRAEEVRHPGLHWAGDRSAADSKSQRRGLESDGENPSDTPDVVDAIDMVLEAWIDIENVQRVRDGLLRVFTEQQLVVVKAPGLSHGDELEPVGFNGHLRVVPRTPAADEACEHCDDGIVWEDGVVGSCCAVCGGVGVVLSPENGERPHTHTRGIDRGDCPECDAEYGDTQ